MRSGGLTHILLVEDNAGDARLLRELLSQAGAGRFKLIHADRLASALTELSQTGIDVILLDLSLPDSHGTETLARVLAASNGIPIVVMTSLDDEELGLQLIQAGAQDYLVKGQVTAPLLTRALRYAIERKRLESELREKSRLLQSVLDSMADGVVMADQVGMFQVWNPAAERIVGAGPANVGIGQWSDHYGLFLPDKTTLYPPDDLPLARAVRGESVANVLVFLRRPDQAEGIWLSVNARPLRDENGRINGGVAVFRDITVAKRMEEALRETEERFRTIMDHSPALIFIKDLEGRYLQVNRRLETLLHLPYGSLLGKTDEEIFPPAQAAAYRANDRRVLEAGAPMEFEEAAAHPDGPQTFLVVKFPLFDAQGRCYALCGIATDITDRKREEEERQKLAKDRLLLLESTGEGIYGMDRQGRCTFVNRAAARMLGYQASEVLGQEMHQLIHHSFADGSALPRARCRIYEAFISGQGCQVEDEVFWRKDGTSFPVSYSSFPVLEQGEITGAVVNFVDCTARKRLEEERSQRAARLLQQQSALIGLTQSRLFQSSPLMATLQHITEVAAKTLAVERISVWRYTDDRTAIQCVDLYILSRNRHLSEVTLQVASCPTYFQALATSHIIAADDAQRDERTAELAGYLSKIGISSMMDVPIYLFGRLEGVICHEQVGPPRRWTDDEQMFAVAMSNLIALAYEQWERRRAEEQLQQSQDRLRNLTARLESVQEEERTRIAREVHDELGQALTAVKLELSRLRDQLPQAPLSLVDTLQSIYALVDTTIQSVRRIATELRPVVLDQLGLVPAIEWQAREFQSRTAIQCTLDIYLRSVSLSQAGSTAMFRIFQEILTNVARHARASAVNINLQEQAGALVLEVRDNGRGVTDAELSNPKSLGLVGMRERALLLGGETTIKGTPGKGTTVKVRIPLDERRPE